RREWVDGGEPREQLGDIGGGLLAAVPELESTFAREDEAARVPRGELQRGCVGFVARLEHTESRGERSFERAIDARELRERETEHRDAGTVNHLRELFVVGDVAAA